MLVNQSALISDIKTNPKKHLWQIEYNDDNTIKSILPYEPVELLSHSPTKVEE